jgi:hypothetical protein
MPRLPPTNSGGHGSLRGGAPRRTGSAPALALLVLGSTIVDLTQKADSMTSTASGSAVPTTQATSNRSVAEGLRCSAIQAMASRRKRRCLSRFTAWAGVPKRSLARVFTSQNTTVFPSAATMSISPDRQRQLRASTSYPRSKYHSATRSSPRAPRSRRCVRLGRGRPRRREEVPRR